MAEEEQEGEEGEQGEQEAEEAEAEEDGRERADLQGGCVQSAGATCFSFSMG